MKSKFKIMLCIALLAAYLCGCGGKSDDNSIIGKWTVKEYEIKGNVISTNDIGEYIGTDFALRNDSSLLFQKSGFVRVNLSGTEEISADETVKYTVTDNTIELYSDDSHLAYLEIDGDTIRAEIGSEMYVIFSKE